VVIHASYKLLQPLHLQSSIQSFRLVKCQVMHPTVPLSSYISDRNTHMISKSSSTSFAATTVHISITTLATESTLSSTSPHSTPASQHTSQHPLPTWFVSGRSSDQPRQSSPLPPADRVNAERRTLSSKASLLPTRWSPPSINEHGEENGF